MSFPVATAVLLFGVIGISANAIFAEVARTQFGIGPSAGACWRCLIAAATLAAVPVFSPGRRDRASRPAESPARGGYVWAAAGGFAFGADLAALHSGFVYAPAARMTLLANFAVLPVATFGWFVLGERPRPLFFGGVLLALVGLAVLLGPGASGGEAWPDLWFGDLLGLTIPFTYAVYQIGVKRARETLGTVPVMLAVSVGASVSLGTVAALNGERWLPTGGLFGWWPLVAMAWGSHLGGQGVIASAFRYLPAGFASAIMLTQPVMVAVMGWLAFGQSLGPTEMAGAAVVIAGLACVVMGREKLNTPNKSPGGNAKGIRAGES
ncbi:MAG: DMT family transporter [Planctomycetota bacterium]